MISFKPMTARRRFLAKLSIAFGSALFFSIPALAQSRAPSAPVNVIFDTDVCLDDDDGMALAMVHALHARHEINLVAVTVGLDEKWCGPYVSVLNTFYGHADVPIGTTRNGLTVQKALEAILKGIGWSSEVKLKHSPDAFVRAILDRKHPDGSPVYPRRLTDGSQAPEAVSLLRKTLAAQPDGSVVMLQVGSSANFAPLLESRPDTISNLSGLDLVKKKVRFLSTMAGTFQDVKLASGQILAKGAGINIFEDVPSAQKVFDQWPTPIVASGTEIGEAIRFPGISIERDFSYVANHPIAEAYRSVCAASQIYNPAAKCPHDHHTADPTATLYGLRPDRNYFSLSKPGKITVLSNGNVRFDEKENGNHRYLIVSEEQKVRAQEAMMMLISQPPVGFKH